MEKNCLVTVIMPAYDEADYVGEAVASVLNQTLADFELIVVDDGSGDGTAAQAAAAARGDGRVKVVRCPPPARGPNAARNLGLAMARGAYVAFTDSDDLMHPRRLELQLAELSRASSAHRSGKKERGTEGEAEPAARGANERRKCGAPANGVLQGSALCISRALEIPRRMAYGELRRLLDSEAPELQEWRSWRTTFAVMLPRRVFQSLGVLHPGLPICEDAEFMYRAGVAGVPRIRSGFLYFVTPRRPKNQTARFRDYDIVGELNRLHGTAHTGGFLSYVREHWREYASPYRPIFPSPAPSEAHRLEKPAEKAQRETFIFPGLPRAARALAPDGGAPALPPPV